MALAVSGNNGQEPRQISDVIIISGCHLWLHLRAFPLHLGIISHLLLLPMFPSDSMTTGKMALRGDAKMTYLVQLETGSLHQILSLAECDSGETVHTENTCEKHFR